ncbi:MAG: PspC domain-containing protein [Bacteroidetes bacterium]|nr:PspC domain-containing protein [Bacteroidota bacterium]MBU1679181.1 PspC domain-containing protein [Bacteroidota bacterium]MBU2508657.1 PspC domain-containing protein [Bacteroidota bacterium]
MKTKLYRSRNQRVLGGVASGIADYLGIDRILSRVFFVLLGFMNSIGIIFYIILWVVLPEEPYDVQYSQPNGDKAKDEEDFKSFEEKEKKYYSEMGTAPKKNGRLIIGLVLICLGIFFLSIRFFPYFDFEDLMPFFLIGLGILLLWNSLKFNR